MFLKLNVLILIRVLRVFKCLCSVFAINSIIYFQGSLMSLSTEMSSEDGGKHGSLHDRIKIVSQQSTARPGCVIQLDAIADATHVISFSCIIFETCTFID